MAPNTIAATKRALAEAHAKGAHTVRISTNILDALLGAHILVAAAFTEIEARKESENGND